MENETRTESGVDKGLVAMFLKMSPEQRVEANDTAARAIVEMRHAYERQTTKHRLAVLKKTLAQLGSH